MDSKNRDGVGKSTKTYSSSSHLKNVLDSNRDTIERDMRNRHNKKRKKIRQQFIFRRTVMGVAVAFVLLIVILIISNMLGFFNARIFVKYVGEGKQNTKLEEISEVLSPINKENVFKISSRDIKQKLSSIPYIDVANVKIKKNYIPAKVTIYYTENIPFFYIEYDKKYVTFDNYGNSLEYTTTQPKDVALAEGITEFFDGKKHRLDVENVRVKSLLMCMEKIKEYDILSNITSINIDENDQITLMYDNKYNVLCGSTYEIGEKIGLLKSAVNDSRVSGSQKGTFDISSANKCIFTP